VSSCHREHLPVELCLRVQIASMLYGYARVSIDGQSVDAQVAQLRERGAARVYRETASGVRYNISGAPISRLSP
jgi:hypothetical protein